MSNQACLFAEDTATPYNPLDEEMDPKANSLQVAGASYQVPAYWLFCFEQSDLVEVETEEGKVPELVATLEQVRTRLAARDHLARELFANCTEHWEEFREVVEAVNRKYLKLDPSEIWMIPKNPNTFTLQLLKALRWFDSQKKIDLDALLSVAQIDGYDRKTKTFIVQDDECPERFLYGWFEDE